MLTSLSLQNFALFKQGEINFKNGFNVILGQSGAGKSIIIDALNFVLGGKADKSYLRTGQKSLRVDAVFEDIANTEVLSELEIEYDGQLVISRTLNEEGKSTIRANGNILPIKDLKLITQDLVDFCGQHDSVGFINVNNHLALLDKYSDTKDLIQEVGVLYLQIQEIDKKIKTLGGSESERARLKEILEYQVREIEDANLVEGEEEELRARFKYISSAEKIYEKVEATLAELDTKADSATSALYNAKNNLRTFSEFEVLESCSERLENAYYEVKDIVENLEDVLKNTDFDQLELERIDKRLDLLKSLERKYGANISEVLAFYDKAKSQLNELEDSEFLIEKLGRQREELSANIEKKCEELSNKRKASALEMEKKIESELADLQMAGTRFKVDFERGEISKNGYDNVKFIFSANLGQSMKDLSKTASGGELSRLLLAFKNIMRDKESTSTIIFDEIDSGISGKTAGKVAEKLKSISNLFQIICITHTPVVASRGNTFLLVTKSNDNNETFSKAEEITGNEIVKQIASLIDGREEVSETAMNHATKLLKEM